MTDLTETPSGPPVDVADELPPKDHNQPPEVLPYDQEEHTRLSLLVMDFCATGKAWLDLKEITTDAQSEALTDFITGARKNHKTVDDKRKAEKKPHDDAGAKIQAAFTPLLNKLKLSAETAKKLQGAYLQKQQRELEEQQRQERLKAEREAEAARAELERAQAENNIAAQVDAEEAVKAAEKVEKKVAKPVRAGAASATGGGKKIALVKTKTANITNINHVFMHYRSNPKVSELLTSLATADLRKKDVEDSSIPGIEIIETESAR